MEEEKIIESLSPNEKKILKVLDSKDIVEISKKTNLDKISVTRALEFLQNKQIVKLIHESKRLVNLGTNGALYKKKGLPERRLLDKISEKRIIDFKEAQKDLTPEEFKGALGSLKKKNLIELKNNQISYSGKDSIMKKLDEEIILETLPLELDKLTNEQKESLKLLEKRKDIIEIKEIKEVLIEITPLGKKLMKAKISDEEMIELITPELLKKESNWKGKKFRRYDLLSPLPEISGGKRHFVNQSIDYARKIWTELGFEEMTGNMVQPSFWNFDALFTAQDHPVREMQDTFFLDKNLKLPEEKLVQKIKESHEKGVDGSKGWNYAWEENEAKKAVLRTHTTCLSALKLAEVDKKDLPKKYFGIGKTFRNETVDWSHGFEFNQTEGIVIDKNANFRHLLGYLKEFYRKMGFEKIKIQPAFFPYTEPSLEIYAWNTNKNKWVEIGGAGILRPEVVIPLLGENIPVLAWGPGFDRILMEYYEVKDLRELYKNDLNKLRKMKYWIK